MAGTEEMMFHALGFPFSESDIVSDLIYLGYLTFMWGIISLATYHDAQRALRRRGIPVKRANQAPTKLIGPRNSPLPMPTPL
jgi:hypothetical protein